MRRPTLKDIAARAGVSPSTVSYALNEQSTLPLAESTKTRIRRIARELGYVPNGLARSLQARSSRMIGLLLNKPLTTPRYAAITQGMARGLQRSGVHLTLLDGAPGAACVDEVRGGRLDGLVFVGHDDHQVPAELAAAIVAHRIPFVSVDCGPGTDGNSWSTVDFDYSVGVEQVTGHLVERGLKHLFYVRPDLVSHAEQARERAVIAALRRYPGITLQMVSTGMTAERLRSFDASPEDYGAYQQGLQTRIDASLGTGPLEGAALLCSWGHDVEVVYRAAWQRTPQVTVAGLASGVMEPSLWPGLVYSRLPLVQAGAECARLILRATHEEEPEHVLLLPELDIG